MYGIIFITREKGAIKRKTLYGTVKSTDFNRELASLLAFG